MHPLTGTSETVAQQIDQVRGVLFAMAHSDGEFLSPVSSIAIHHALAARGRKVGVLDLMDRLVRVRDIQDLTGGYWLPVTTRSVPLGGCALLISGKPTSFLNTDYGLCPFGTGYGRLVAWTTSSQALASEPLSRWLSAPPLSSEWADQLVCSVQWSDPLGVGDFQIFDHWSRKPQTRWIESGALNVPDGPVAARHVFPTGAVDHYLVRFRRGRAEQLASLANPDHAHRLRIALLAKAGNPRRWTVQQVDANHVRLTTFHLPHDEMRLLESIAQVENNEGELHTDIPIVAADAVCHVFARLGLAEGVPVHE